MRIRITQFAGPEHTFDSVAEYKAFIQAQDPETGEELVHLQEYVELVIDRVPNWIPVEDLEETILQLAAMWKELTQ
jgi:hypothetical protein